VVGHSKGYTQHAISVVAEWTMAALVVLLIMTLYFDFKRITLVEPRVIIIDEASTEAMPV